jgi:ketosteroid isomerase-like protein
MRYLFAVFFVIGTMSFAAISQTTISAKDQAVKDNIIALEKSWNAGIQSRDVQLMEQFLADGYFLGIGVKGRPLTVVPRKTWLASLPNYKVESYSIDDIHVGVYDKMAVVLMMYTQKAKVGPNGDDRSAQFVITDIWTKTKKGWRVAERHSSRPEQ